MGSAFDTWPFAVQFHFPPIFMRHLFTASYSLQLP